MKKIICLAVLLFCASSVFSQVQLGDSLSIILEEVVLDDAGLDLPADSTYYNLTILREGSAEADTIFFRKPSAEMPFGAEFLVDGSYIDEAGVYEFIYSAVLKVSANPAGEVWREGEPDTLEVEILDSEPTIASFFPASAREGDTVTISGTDLSGALQVIIGSTSAAVFDVTDTSLSFVVPTGASSGLITVVLNLDGSIITISTAESLAVLPPVVTRRPAKAKITLKTGS